MLHTVTARAYESLAAVLWMTSHSSKSRVQNRPTDYMLCVLHYCSGISQHRYWKKKKVTQTSNELVTLKLKKRGTKSRLEMTHARQ